MRARLALGCLMNVGGGVSRRLVVTPEVLEDDVPADVVLLAIDTILIKPLGAGKTTGWVVVAVDDLVQGCDHAVGRGEFERTVHALLLVTVLPAALPVTTPGLSVLPRRSGSRGWKNGHEQKCMDG